MRPCEAQGLACYVCTSVNGSYPDCEDPVKGSIPFEAPCRQGRPGYEGLSYARYCVKIKGERVSDGQTIYIRRCSMDKLADVPTHCGQFRLSDDLYQGCIATCTQNWCNVGSRYTIDLGLTTFVLLLLSPLT
ncbi:unnamed protein product [Dibothriocephalus latus]|uniref:Protein quiver n=1 Tax=Dibothriocephalus latus TaxID=60516 RepID=A0A3P7M0B3_DIBLA|nr:unnamed protein product [Dibothriocephalus latus]